MNLARHLALIVLAVLVLASNALAIAPGYTITSIGGFEYGRIAWEINDSGQVIVAIGGGTGYFWNGGTLLPLPPVYSLSYPYGLNDYGQICGLARDANGKPQGVLWTANTMTHELGLMGGDVCELRDINNAGQVVGASTPSAAPAYTGFVWQGGTTTYLGNPSGYYGSNPIAINDQGLIAGITSGASGPRAFLYQDGTWTILPTLYGQDEARDLNECGQVVGQGEQNIACLWEQGTVKTLWTSSGGDACAWGINDVGQVVGFRDNTPRDRRACLWENGVYYDLNDLLPEGSDWVLVAARDINDQGQIVGEGWHPVYRNAVFIMTPVPEPSSLLALGLGLLVLCDKGGRIRAGTGWRARRRSQV